MGTRSDAREAHVPHSHARPCQDRQQPAPPVPASQLPEQGSSTPTASPSPPRGTSERPGAQRQRHADPTATQPGATKMSARPRPNNLRFTVPPLDSSAPHSPVGKAGAKASASLHTNPLTADSSVRTSGKPRAAEAAADPMEDVNSDDDFVFILQNVHSTADAIDKIREIQKGRSASGVKGPGGGRSSSKSGSGATGRVSAKPKHPRSELPETLSDFYSCPNYIVSLVVGRQALFEDALSGFHSLVKREEAEMASLNQKRAEVVKAKRAAEEARRAAAANTDQSRTTARRDGHRRSATAVSATETGRRPSAPAPSSPRRTASASEPLAATPPAHEEDVPASLMFLWRARDEAALRAMSAPSPSKERRTSAWEPAQPAHAHAASTTLVQAPPSDGLQGMGGAAAPGGALVEVLQVQRSPADDAAAEALRQEEQYMAFLKTKEHARRRAPEVFRFIYPPAIDFEKSGGSRLVDPLDVRMAWHAARQNPQNHLIKEWLYVWEQFERDIHRETLLIEGTPYNHADEAIAAIASYVEYAYDRGQEAGRARLKSSHEGNDRRGSRSHLGDGRGAARAKSGAPTEAAKALVADPTTKGSAAGCRGQQQQPTAAPDAVDATPPKPGKRGFFDSIVSAGAAALKDVAIRAHETLPSFMSHPLVAASGLDAATMRAVTAYPSDPVLRGRKVFNAIREVVLASQQSFMGFPYQLLCEQVGTERLALALEEYMEEELEDLKQVRECADSSTATAPSMVSEKGGVQPPAVLMPQNAGPSSPLTLPSAVIPLAAAAQSDGCASPVSSAPRASFAAAGTTGSPLSQSYTHRVAGASNGSASLRQEGSPRVLRIYHSGPDKSKRHDAALSSSAPRAEASALANAPAASPTKAREDGGRAAGTPLKRPSAAAAAQRRLEERRREREKRLPLLVGEPRPAEFRAFLGIIRAKVEAKNAQDESAWKRRQQQCRPPSKQTHSVRAAQGSGQARTGANASTVAQETGAHGDATQPPSGHSPPATASDEKHSGPRERANSADTTMSFDSSDSAGEEGAEAPHHRRHGLFRSDVDGSAYLIRLSPPHAGDRANARESSESDASLTTSSTTATSRHPQGMRIHVYFNPRRNAPVVCVNKVFRLFIVPGLSSFAAGPASHGSGEAVNSAGDDEWGSKSRGSEEAGRDGRCLLLLIQIEFTLFTQEEAEVRWRWYTV